MHAGCIKKKELETAIRLGHAVCDAGAVHEFNCEVCRMRGDDRGRACFRFNDRADVSCVSVSGRTLRNTGETRNISRNDVWQFVERVQAGAPDKDILEILHGWMNVCPEGMITRDVQDYLEQEMVCETYKTPPVAGGVEDWPALVYDAFNVIRQTHQAIKIEKNRELKHKMDAQRR